MCATASAQTLTTILTFDGADGTAQVPELVEGRDGNLYGVTTFGGNDNGGTVFKITPNGTITTLYDFCTSSGCGYYPAGALVLGADGNFYGTTEEGGTTS